MNLLSKPEANLTLTETAKIALELGWKFRDDLPPDSDFVAAFLMAVLQNYRNYPSFLINANTKNLLDGGRDIISPEFKSDPEMRAKVKGVLFAVNFGSSLTKAYSVIE